MVETIEIDLEKLIGAVHATPGKNAADYSESLGRSSAYFSGKLSYAINQNGKSFGLTDLNEVCRYLRRSATDFLICHQERIPKDYHPGKGKTRVQRLGKRDISPD